MFKNSPSVICMEVTKCITLFQLFYYESLQFIIVIIVEKYIK